MPQVRHAAYRWSGVGPPQMSAGPTGNWTSDRSAGSSRGSLQNRSSAGNHCAVLESPTSARPGRSRDAVGAGRHWWPRVRLGSRRHTGAGHPRGRGGVGRDADRAGRWRPGRARHRNRGVAHRPGRAGGRRSIVAKLPRAARAQEAPPAATPRREQARPSEWALRLWPATPGGKRRGFSMTVQAWPTPGMAAVTTSARCQAVRPPSAASRRRRTTSARDRANTRDADPDEGARPRSRTGPRSFMLCPPAMTAAVPRRGRARRKPGHGVEVDWSRKQSGTDEGANGPREGLPPRGGGAHGIRSKRRRRARRDPQPHRRVVVTK